MKKAGLRKCNDLLADREVDTLIVYVDQGHHRQLTVSVFIQTRSRAIKTNKRNSLAKASHQVKLRFHGSDSWIS